MTQDSDDGRSWAKEKEESKRVKCSVRTAAAGDPQGMQDMIGFGWVGWVSG